MEEVSLQVDAGEGGGPISVFTSSGLLSVLWEETKTNGFIFLLFFLSILLSATACVFHLFLLTQNENLMIKVKSILPGFKLHTCGWQLIQVYYYPDKLLTNKAAPRAYFQVQQYIRYNSPNHLPSPFPPIWLHFNSKCCLERCQELSNDELTAQLPRLPAW